jgi:hypothetical protein
MSDGVTVIVGLLQRNPVEKLNWPLQRTRVLNFVQFFNGPFWHAQIKVAISGQDSTHSFRCHLNSHRTRSLLSETGFRLIVIELT